MLCDALLIVALLRPAETICKASEYHATIELNGIHTRGQVVLNHMKTTAPNVKMIESLNVDECKRMLMWTIDQIDIKF